MGLLDEVMSQFGAATGRPIEPGHHGLARELLGMFAPSGMSGGLANLINICHQRGLGDEVNSWISTGENLPITAEQVKSILGSSEIQSLAARAGIDPQARRCAAVRADPSRFSSTRPRPTGGSRPLAISSARLGMSRRVLQEELSPEAAMLIGAHSILYSTSPEADRAFLRDVLELRGVDVGGGG